MTEQMKAASRAVFEIWNTGAVGQLDELVAAGVIHHDPHDPHAAEGLAGMKKTIELTRLSFPDLQITVEAQLAEGDLVATRWSATLTHSGEFAGLAPTQKRGSLTGITIDRFEEGKVVEAWRNMDRLGLLQSIGVIPRQ